MESLQRSLRWPSVAAYGLGTILGAGIYSVIGAAAGLVGEGMWLAFGVSSLIALVTALSYAELAPMFPKAGAEFVYLQHALPRQRMLAFAVGAMMAASCAATGATVSIAFGGYLSSIADLPAALIAPGLIIVLTGVALLGIKESATMVAVFTCIEALGLVIVIAVGATTPSFGDAFATVPHENLFAGAALLFFSYLGFENIANLAEETREPERALPRAILVSIGVATLLYVLVAIAAVALLPAPELAASDAPLADAVRMRSPTLAGALGGIALFATANTAMASIVSGSRIIYALAQARELPTLLGRISKKSHVPWIATLAIAVVSLALLPLGEVAIVAGVSSFASLLAFAAVNVAVVILRRRDHTTPRPFRIPLALGGIPVFPVVGALSSLFLVTQLQANVLVAGAVVFVAILVAYAAFRGVNGRGHTRPL